MTYLQDRVQCRYLKGKHGGEQCTAEAVPPDEAAPGPADRGIWLCAKHHARSLALLRKQRFTARLARDILDQLARDILDQLADDAAKEGHDQ